MHSSRPPKGRRAQRKQVNAQKLPTEGQAWKSGACGTGVGGDTSPRSGCCTVTKVTAGELEVIEGVRSIARHAGCCRVTH